MDIQVKERYEQRARIIKALAHPTRLFMVDVLAGRDHCVCELTEMVGDDVSTISKHLSVLKKAGIVKDRREGQQIFYSLKVPCVRQFFTCAETVMAANPAEVAIVKD